MPLRARRSIGRKLTVMNMLVSGAALLLACASFIAYDLISFRSLIVNNLTIRSSVIGANSVSALTFDDPAAAETTLSTLQADPNLVSAALYGADGRLFAAYRRASGLGVEARLPETIAVDDETRQSWSNDPGIIVMRPILFQGTRPGTVRLRSDLGALRDRLMRFVLIVVIVLAGSLVAAFLISRVAQRSIAAPMVELAKFSEQVARDRDYSVRAPAVDGGPEFEMFTSAFNDMLTEIEYRDVSLRASRDELEERVQQRTAELTSVNQELEAFSYSVSHDLRAPLRHVSGFVSLLNAHAGPSLDAQSQRYLATIAQASARMGQLIDDLLAFSRMSRSTLTKQSIDLGVLVREAQAEVMGHTPGRDIEWKIHPLPEIAADRPMLRLAVVNLLSNAVKYSSTRSHACIEIGAIGDDRLETVMFVADNGVGFDMQYLHKLFGVFQRLHRVEEFDGTGIGLANVRRIIQRHGGRVWAEGEVDKGATFYFALPRERTL